jgi:hypothetical protein
MAIMTIHLNNNEETIMEDSNSNIIKDRDKTSEVLLPLSLVIIMHLLHKVMDSL